MFSRIIVPLSVRTAFFSLTALWAFRPYFARVDAARKASAKRRADAITPGGSAGSCAPPSSAAGTSSPDPAISPLPCDSLSGKASFRTQGRIARSGRGRNHTGNQSSSRPAAYAESHGYRQNREISPGILKEPDSPTGRPWHFEGEALAFCRKAATAAE
jgi:hypothetical protein